jgi:signal transduction histidine kinase
VHHLNPQILTELIETRRQAADVQGLVSRALAVLARHNDVPLALFVSERKAPHTLRASAVNKLDPALVPVLAVRVPQGIAPFSSEGLPEGSLAGSVPLASGTEQVSLVCASPCSEEFLFLVMSFVAMAVDRDAAAADARRLSDLFNAGPVVIFRWRNAPNWPVEFVSPNVTKAFGHPVETLLEQPYAPFVHPSDILRVGEEVAEAIRLGATYFEQQYRVRDAKGGWIDAYDFTHVVRNAAGEVTHFHGYLFDDSRRRAAERAREELTDQLQQSQKLQAVGTLASGIAHDFNNVLAAILAHLDLLRLEPAFTDHPDILAATRSALRGRDIVKQLLVFTRSRTEERTTWRLQQLIEEAIGLVRSSIPSTVGLRLALDPRTPPVVGDGTQLQQVLVNLVTNAAHAMPKGGTVEISVEPSADGQRAQLVVKDSGQGMSPEVLERAFEPFFTTKPVGQGTGLGLAMVHSIVTAHDGTIHLDSSVGAGTKAIISLPAAKIVAPAVPSEAPNVAKGTAQRIALVEDEALVAKATERLVAHFGYAVTVHQDALSVLDAFEKDPRAYDLVLTDQTMPQLTGLELARRLRALGVTVPVLLVTGLSAMIDESQVAQPFMVLGKPYRSEELAASLSKLLSGVAGRAPTP